jgi:hypothetical protein
MMEEQVTLIWFDPPAEVSVETLETMPRKMTSSSAFEVAERGAVEITTGSCSIPPREY